MRVRGLPGCTRGSRNTGLYRRQGEWFLLPAPELDVADAPILANEPIRRGGGKPHMCEEQRQAAPPFQVMRRNPLVNVRGRISHPDHATITLNGWHLVLLNTESGARASSNVAFLD